jgi:hypothetical protein
MGTTQEITATFSEPMNPATILASGTFTVTGPLDAPVAGTVTYDVINKTAILPSRRIVYRYDHNGG